MDREFEKHRRMILVVESVDEISTRFQSVLTAKDDTGCLHREVMIGITFKVLHDQQ